jgi:hypothetical protein
LEAFVHRHADEMDLDENHKLEDIYKQVEYKLRSFSAEYREKEETCMDICYPQYKEKTSKIFVTQTPQKQKFSCLIKLTII